MDNLEQQVATALGMQEQVGSVEEASTKTEDTVSTETAEQQTTEVTESEDKTASTDSKTAGAENSTIKQMREQISNSKNENARLQNLLKRIADEKGIPVEQLEEEIQAKEDKRKAEAMNVPPEVAKQLRMQEERIKQLEEQSIQEDLMHRVNDFKKSTGFNDQQTLQFLRDAQARGLNPLNKGTDLLTLYRAINFEALSKAKEAEIRQQILNDMQRQREQGNDVVNHTGSTAPTGTSTEEISDQDFMKQLKQNLKK